MEKWTTCVSRIETLGLEGEEAETVVGQAFGFGKQSYWLNKKKEEVPDLEQVSMYLRGTVVANINKCHAFRGTSILHDQ